MYKLGKLAPSNKLSVSFGDFVSQVLPTSPIIDLGPNYVYPMFGNDVWGDCVCADEGHSQQVTTGLLTGTETVATIQQIETWYKTQNPMWSPTSGSEGNGMDIQTFLNYLTSQKTIVGFARIDFHNIPLLQAAIYIGLSIKIGVQLQQAQQGRQFEDGLWDYIPGSPIVGGHDICFVGYNATTKRYQLISWGKLIECTQTFVDNLVDEAWFPIRPEHLAHPGFRDNFDTAGFSAAVSAITNGKINIPMQPTYSASFVKAITNVLNWEGGLNNDPLGGWTNFGISQKAYPALNIQTLTKDQAISIYFRDYWTPIHGDSMPSNFAYNVLDCAVNEGVNFAIKTMQTSIGVIADGAIGPITLAAMAKATSQTIAKFSGIRTYAYTQDTGFLTNGHGWITRAITTTVNSLTT